MSSRRTQAAGSSRRVSSPGRVPGAGRRLVPVGSELRGAGLCAPSQPGPAFSTQSCSEMPPWQRGQTREAVCWRFSETCQFTLAWPVFIFILNSPKIKTFDSRPADSLSKVVLTAYHPHASVSLTATRPCPAPPWRPGIQSALRDAPPRRAALQLHTPAAQALRGALTLQRPPREAFRGQVGLASARCAVQGRLCLAVSGGSRVGYEGAGHKAGAAT